MDTTKAQKALDDALVAPENRLKIGNPQLKFLEIYMQEFWATVTKHHFSLQFKMDGKSNTANVDNFKDMLKIFLKLLGQKFKDPPFEEEILSFIRDLGHTDSKPNLTKKKADSESSPKTKPTKASKGKRIKSSAKGDIPAKKKQSTTKPKGLTVAHLMLHDLKLNQIIFPLERSNTQHSSHSSGSVQKQEQVLQQWFHDVPSYDSEAEQIS
ncbi:hypothetical protein Tco_0307046 [Tanacetum coccineum]